MKYVVAYQSKSGNTRRIAQEIFNSLENVEKEICDIDQRKELPEADVYFIGFGIHDSNCSMKIIDLLGNIAGKKCALFATCGYAPIDEYKNTLEKNTKVWILDETEYMGMFLCQGKVQKDQQSLMLDKMPEVKDILMKMFEMGRDHPDENDLDKARQFAAMIQNKINEIENRAI